ncbi:MAG: hypothetical protein ISR84_01750 [Kiritimatiellales bacterium]|nr:hypothetical protein [Kiritimatiellales bacterium]
MKAGHLCCSGMIDSFCKGGYSKLIMAVGDHEVGDNPWPAGSDVSRCYLQVKGVDAINSSARGGRAGSGN